MSNFEKPPTGGGKENSTEENATVIPAEKVEVLPPISEEKEKFDPAALRKELDDLIDEFNRIEDQRSFGFEHMFGPATPEAKQRIQRQKEIAARAKEVAGKLGLKINIKL